MLLLLLLRLLVLCIGLLLGQRSAHGQWGPPPVIGGQDEVVEGCFNRFDVGTSFALGRENTSNLRCQHRCTEAGYALSATTAFVCLCGNDYPGEAHRVETGRCSHPCNPDKVSCHLFTCCGDANGTLFTVSWSGEIDPMKQVLRKLAHNYRASVSFRRKIEGQGFGDRVPLLLARGNEDDGTPPLFLTVGDGCPPGWTGFSETEVCFTQHWAQPSTRGEAEAACKAEGAELVTEADHATAGASLAAYLQQQRQDGCLGQSWSDPDADNTLNAHAWGPRGPLMDAKHKQSTCFICKQPRAATYPALRPHADECWFVDVVNETTRDTADPAPYPWCADCFEAYLQSDRNNQYLCADAQNWLYLSWARDPAWCLWTLLVHPDTGALVLLTRHNAALFYSAETGVLACRNLPSNLAIPPPPTNPNAGLDWERAVAGQDAIACLAPSSLPHALAARHLRISVYGIHRWAPQLGLRECSIAAYDTAPTTPSFTCSYRAEDEGGAITENLIWFRQAALRIYDKSHYVTAREPLPNGRLQCLNRSPMETVSCVFAYGQALQLIRRFRAHFGLIILDTNTWVKQVLAEQDVTVRYPAFGGAAAGGGGGGGGARQNQLRFVTRESKLVQNSLTFLFNTFYQVVFAKVFIETRNWQLGVNLFPMTTVTIQFWLTTHYLRYRWRAAFQARGGFRISLFGRPIADGFHSLGDLVEGQELMFHMFGTLEEPLEASVTVTDVEQGEMSWWGIDMPLVSQGDEVGGQLGGRHSEFLPARGPGYG